jgi:hypothetical protein
MVQARSPCSFAAEGLDDVPSCSATAAAYTTAFSALITLSVMSCLGLM